VDTAPCIHWLHPSCLCLKWGSNKNLRNVENTFTFYKKPSPQSGLMFQVKIIVRKISAFINGVWPVGQTGLQHYGLRLERVQCRSTRRLRQTFLSNMSSTRRQKQQQRLKLNEIHSTPFIAPVQHRAQCLDNWIRTVVGWAVLCSVRQKDVLNYQTVCVARLPAHQDRGRGCICGT